MKYFWMLVAGLLLVVWFKLRARRSSQDPAPPEKDKKSVLLNPTNMVKCTFCGVHLPHEEALSTQGRAYCCIDHLQKDHEERGLQ